VEKKLREINFIAIIHIIIPSILEKMMCPQIGITYDFCNFSSHFVDTFEFFYYQWWRNLKKKLYYVLLIRDYEDELNYTFLLMNKAERLGCFLCMQINI